ncbi:NAD-P-binding protein [Mycena filopes]|nr:NAD-P-binding protein [Mycena filopes]
MSQNAFTAATTAEEVASAFKQQIQGKNVLITGTSLNGIGFETARVLAKYANQVIITGYNLERLKLSEDTIKKEIPGANIRPLVLDLTSLASVREAAAEVNAYPDPLHVLINNAASGTTKYALTVDNLESQMATNHFGPFLLTKLLAPKLLASGTTSYTPRVVYVSSGAHTAPPGPNLDIESLARSTPATYNTLPRSVEAKSANDLPPMDKSTRYNAFPRYVEGKAANVLAAMEISTRSHGKINGYGLHPGVISTNLNQKEELRASLVEIGMLHPDGTPNTENLSWKTIPQGAATTVVAAFDPSLDATPGAYLDDCLVANEKRAPHCDAATASKLWKVTEEILGETFRF